MTTRSPIASARRALLGTTLGLFALAVLPTASQAADPAVLRVTAIPDEAPTELARKFEPLGKYLEDKLPGPSTGPPPMPESRHSSPASPDMAASAPRSFSAPRPSAEAARPITSGQADGPEAAELRDPASLRRWGLLCGMLVLLWPLRVTAGQAKGSFGSLFLLGDGPFWRKQDQPSSAHSQFRLSGFRCFLQCSVLRAPPPCPPAESPFCRSCKPAGIQLFWQYS